MALPMQGAHLSLPLAPRSPQSMQRSDDSVLAGILAQPTPTAPQQRSDDAALLGVLSGQRGQSMREPHEATLRPQPMGMRKALGVMGAQARQGLQQQQQQQHDDALLAGVMQQTPPAGSQQRSLDDTLLSSVLQQGTGGYARKPLPQDRRDDDVLASMLGQTPTGDPRQKQDDAMLAKCFQSSASNTRHHEDDTALVNLLDNPRLMSGGPVELRRPVSATAGRKGLPGDLKRSQAPMSTGGLVAESLNHFLLGWPRGTVHAEVVAGGNGKGGQAHQLFRPLGIALDGQRGLLVADNGNHRVVRWGLGATRAPRGEVVIDSRGYGNSWFDPLGLAVVGGGTILVSVSGGVELWERGEQSPEVIAYGHWPAGIAVDMTGTVFFADMLEHCVKQYPSIDQGDVVAGGCQGRRAGEDGDWHCPACAQHQLRRSRACRDCGTPRASWQWTNQLHRPFGLAVDRAGSGIFIADSANHRVVHWARGAAEGVVVAGGKGAGSRPDQLHCPRDVVLDSFGALLVADTMNHRVMRYANPLQPPDGPKTRSGRRGELVAGGQGQGHRVNQLSQPNCLAIDAEGALYIADTGNHRVVRWHISPQC